jgi:hypothetical protein
MLFYFKFHLHGSHPPGDDIMYEPFGFLVPGDF